MAVVRTRAPGRVNVIGEHTDYNDGFVLPLAIDRETFVEARRRDDGELVLRSANVTGEEWTVYVRGIAIELARAGVRAAGAELHVRSDVPIGAGLSSSAALEIASALALLHLAGVSMDPADLAQLAQRAEIEHAGTRCGIMDQLICTTARAGYATLIDTRTLERREVPLPSSIAIVVCNTMIRHAHAQSGYNERRDECERAAQLLGVRALRDASLVQIDVARAALGEVLYRRAKHVVSENERVRAAARALAESDPRELGVLLARSHESLRDDFEVSCLELDTMVDLARGFDGTIGARMTGGGFGGCAIALVVPSRVDAFAEEVSRAYHERTSVEPELYVVKSAPAASVIATA